MKEDAYVLDLYNNPDKLYNHIDEIYDHVSGLIQTKTVKQFYDKRKTRLYRKDNELETDTPLITFVMPLKNRKIRATLSLKSLRGVLNHKVQFIIVEDKSEDQIPLELLKDQNIEYYLVDTESPDWSRSKLLNFGIKKAKGKYIIPWDACFLCNKDFIDSTIGYLQKIDTDKHLVSIAVYETHKTSRSTKGRGYGNMWVYETDKIKQIGGFDQSFISHGYEDRDLEFRYNRFFTTTTLHSFFVDSSIFVLHLSHRRFTDSNYIKNRKKYNQTKKEKNYVLDASNWGSLKLVYSNLVEQM